MHPDDKNSQKGRWTQILDELSLPEMLAMYDYASAGVDCEIIIGDENDDIRHLRNPDIPRGAFTAVGKLTPEGLARVSKTIAEKYRCKIILLCLR